MLVVNGEGDDMFERTFEIWRGNDWSVGGDWLAEVRGGPDRALWALRLLAQEEGEELTLLEGGRVRAWGSPDGAVVVVQGWR